ncbi:MAG: Verru_Chthon cassette protein B [Candidatus Methylacidiphilales bacterium]|nr:Verru_Chthon cassette protein B [Candidatus Methylacidiphilales bacterium]
MNSRRLSLYQKARAAFSLIEVTIAIGITAFGGITMMGLLSVGLSNFRSAVDMSVGAQIMQQVVADVQQSSFSNIQSSGGSNALPDTAVPLPVRYFDDQGTEQGRNGAALPVNQPVVYHVAVGVSVNTTGNLATVVVDVVNNPGNKTLPRDGATGGFSTSPTSLYTPTRYTFFVSKTQ